MRRTVSVCEGKDLNEKIEKVIFSENSYGSEANNVVISERDNTIEFNDKNDLLESKVDMGDIPNLIKALQLIQKEYNL